MANDLLIKINADAANAKKEFDNIKKQTEDLEETLGKVARVSAVAFAALTAEVFFSVKAFEEADKASRDLSQALQNQGIYTEALVKDYKEYAAAVQVATGIDDDAIVKSQAIAQSYLGQTQVTEELTFAIADLSETMGGDLNGAAEKIARTIGTGTNAFARQGLVLAEGATEAERYAKTLEFVQLKAGGLAASANEGVGGIRGLTNAFGNFQEQIGAGFAPIIAGAISLGTKFFQVLANHPIVADLAVAFVTAGAAITGVIAAIAGAAPIFLALQAAAVALGTTLTISLAGIPLLIGAVIGAVTLLALNWDKAMAGLAAAARGAVVLISELFTGLGQVLSGAFHLDPAKLEQGLATIKGSFAKTASEVKTTYQEITATQAEEGEKQDAKKKELADREAARERQHQALLRGIRTAEIELLRLQNEHASADLIALKQQEIETLKALDSEKSAEELRLFQERRERIKALQDQQLQEDLERQAEFAQIQAEAKADLDAQGIEVDAVLREEKLAELRATAQTESDIERQLQEDILSRKIQARNTELLDRKKYGEAIAKINKAITSDEVQGVRSASSELVALQQSKNATLKGIGKAAAVANIAIATAESAMNVYRGFSTIPIIGPALGIAAAAAAVAFGAERTGEVIGAADGGLIEGGIQGKDSVPAMLEPGELVVPRKNFKDVVSAVNQTSGGSDDSSMIDILERIEGKLETPNVFNFNGDVTTDDSYIDNLIRRISDGVQYRNGQIAGVTS